jgi:hypothetical protein
MAHRHDLEEIFRTLSALGSPEFFSQDADYHIIYFSVYMFGNAALQEPSHNR